ncbi:MAG: hypothetical protein AB1554_06550 [Chloroflexota bacterium]
MTSLTLIPSPLPRFVFAGAPLSAMRRNGERKTILGGGWLMQVTIPPLA